jgi:hypothetical protein
MRAIVVGAMAALMAAISAASAEQAFDDIAKVLTSPRCMNCHTVTNFPRQGDDRHPHRMNVSRGPDNHGAPGLHCTACHVSFNQAGSGVPGAPHWGLAPLSMGWEGLSSHELCTTLKDSRRNGNRDTVALVHHMTEDPLVQWAWTPGQGRSTPPISRRDFHDLVRKWAADGAPCP